MSRYVKHHAYMYMYVEMISWHPSDLGIVHVDDDDEDVYTDEDDDNNDEQTRIMMDDDGKYLMMMLMFRHQKLMFKIKTLKTLL